MAGVTAHGGTFTFTASQAGAISAIVTRLSVETPTAEVVDMTPITATASQVVLVPTGAWTGGQVAVDYIHAAGGFDPQSLVRQHGSLSFSSGNYSVTRNAILESATTEASVGDIVKGSLRFRITDYTG